MIIQFKNGSTIKSLPGGECKRSKRGQKQIEKIQMKKNESYDEVLKQIKTEVENNEKSNNI